MTARSVSVLLLLLTAALPAAALGPQPGDVYREYYVMMGGGKDWRVTDPSVKRDRAEAFLPNSTFEVNVDDLRGARRAELQIDRWGGHAGTSGQSVRLNALEWLPLPDIHGTPAGVAPVCFIFQDNPIVEVPLGHLRMGRNSLEATSGPQVCHSFNWGQWGWYSAILRVYYDSSKAHPVGRISSPAPGASIGDNPLVEVETSGPAAVNRVDVLAWYDGYDENGDGVFADWHHSYHYVDLSGHAGTALSSPFRVRWDTAWVPDQKPGGVRLMARVRDASGMWSVSPVVDKLTLARRGFSVKLYKPLDVPQRFTVRNKRTMSSKVLIPPADDLKRATAALVHIRTWNGAVEQYKLNEWADAIGGTDHNFAYTTRPAPVSALRPGENLLTFHSDTLEHGVEVSWPGPAVSVRYGAPPPPRAAASDWLNHDYRFRLPVEVAPADLARRNMPVEIDLDFTELIAKAGGRGAFDERSIRVVQLLDPHGSGHAAPAQAKSAPPHGGHDGQAVVKDGFVWWQFDKAEAFDAEKNARGTLMIWVSSLSAKAPARRFHVYFSTKDSGAPVARVPSRVSVTGEMDYQGQPSFVIQGANATYYYHKEGAGFASMIDQDGQDWISYRPGMRSAGEFRGIPNLGKPFGHPGYSGESGSRSWVESNGPLRVLIRSLRQDGAWAADWAIFPNSARMTMQKAAGPYWFLYEGTPGGKLDLDSDYYVLSDGQRRPVTEHWKQDIAGPEWVYFGDGARPRVLYLINHQEDEAVDQYWPMEGNMTVFGFGRQYRCCGQYLTAAPGRYTIGFLESNEPKQVKQIIESALREVEIRLGAVQASNLEEIRP